MAQTARTLIERACILTGALAEGETLSAQMASTGLGVLQDTINAWANDRLMIYVQGRSVQSLVANQGDYTIGTGGNWSQDRPVSIDRMTIQDPTASPVFEFPPMHAFSDDEWASVRMKAITSAIPTGYYYNQTYPLGTISLYMVPDNSTYKAVIYYPDPTATTVATLNTSLSYPPGYDKALRYSLAYELSLIPGYARGPREDLRAMAATALHAITAVNAVPMVLKSDYQTSDQGTYNWRTGESS